MIPEFDLYKRAILDYIGSLGPAGTMRHCLQKRQIKTHTYSLFYFSYCTESPVTFNLFSALYHQKHSVAVSLTYGLSNKTDESGPHFFFIQFLTPAPLL